VYERARILPLARLVYTAEIIPDSNAAISRIHDPAFDPANTAILDKAPPCELGPAPTSEGTAEIVAHQPTRWTIRTTSDAPALLVLAENAYPGWEVEIDGVSAEALTAYTSMRAACVPAGEHTIEWHFSPWLYYWGAAISALAFLLVLAALIIFRRTITSVDDGFVHR
jgi:hypothetical protein